MFWIDTLMQEIIPVVTEKNDIENRDESIICIFCDLRTFKFPMQAKNSKIFQLNTLQQFNVLDWDLEGRNHVYSHGEMSLNK